MIDESQISALFYLLEDPDDEVYSAIKQKLVSYGSELIPELENQREATESSLVQERISDILRDIRFQVLCDRLDYWSEFKSYDLLKGVILACSYQFPETNPESLTFTVLNIKREIARTIGGLKPQNSIILLNSIFFGDYGFRVVNKEGISPKNYFINYLISNKKGEIIAICLLYIILSRELNLSVHLAIVPNNRFLLACYEQFNLHQYSNPEEQKQQLLFFIDPTRKGNILSVQEVNRRFFEQEEFDLNKLKRLNNKGMLVLLFELLQKYYENANNTVEKIKEIQILIDILSKKDKV